MAKRMFDIVVSLLLLVFFSPIFILVFLFIRVSMGGPVLFRQIRPGLHEHPFTLFKFRTMTDQINASGDLLPDKDRLTKSGLFLRKTSLDELPQLFNVLKGEMSLVGPRPLLMEYLPLYSSEQAKRHHVRPGITGWAQVHGRNTLSWKDKFYLDVWYVENVSFILDMKILGMTVIRVFQRSGINALDADTMKKFTGNS